MPLSRWADVVSSIVAQLGGGVWASYDVVTHARLTNFSILEKMTAFRQGFSA